jgi:cytochrome b561
MSWKSSTRRYGSVAIAIHWVSAVAILAQLAFGFLAASAADPAAQANWLRAHVSLGLFVVTLTLVRIGWWFIDRRPPPLAELRWWQELSERTVRVLLYLLILVLGASGIAVLALSGAGGVLFFGAPGPLPDFARYAPMAAHVAAATALLALAALHILAALYHHFYRRDALLGRMWTGQMSTEAALDDLTPR